MHSNPSQRLRRQANLYVQGLLAPRKLASFEKSLSTSRTLQDYVEQLRSVISSVSDLPGYQPTDTFLRRQRTILRGRIDLVTSQPSYLRSFERIRAWVQSIVRPMLFPRRPALAAITYVLLGLVLGRIFLLPSTVVQTPRAPLVAVKDRIQRMMQSGRLVADEIEYTSNGTEEVTFHLRAEDRFAYTGRMGDETVRDLLFYFLLNESNPGKRLRSIKLASEFTDDDQLKTVLVAALLSDSNPGMRLRAIKSLAKYSPDKMIRDAGIKTLLQDNNAAVRMEALAILEQNPDEKLLPVLQVVSRLDENEHIRQEASDLLGQIAQAIEIEPLGVEQ